MIDIDQFTDYVIDPVLEQMVMYSVAASELLLGTAIQESRLTYIKQLGNGPAMGVFQMEPATFKDIWQNYLAYRPNIADVARTLSGTRPQEYPVPEQMITNLAFAACMCRVHYRRVREPLPTAGDLPSQAAYWKQHYNTPLGRGTQTEYIENWERAHEH